MKYSFSCYGHENIVAKHKTTLEFTKDKDLSLKGDCIIGVKADFSLLELKKFIKTLKNNKVTIIITPILNNDETNGNKTNNNIVEKIKAEINADFNDENELVVRKTGFISERTFAINANKAAFELNDGLIGFLKENNKIRIVIEKR